MKYLLILLFLFSFSSAWALPECPGSPLNLKSIDDWPWHWDNCEGRYIVVDAYTDGGKHLGDNFLGTFKKGKRVYGTYNYSNGNKYVGYYKDFFNRNLKLNKVEVIYIMKSHPEESIRIEQFKQHLTDICFKNEVLSELLSKHEIQRCN